MKFKINVLKKSILGSLLLTPLLLIGAKNVHASTVATVNANVKYAQLYTKKGNVISNLVLGANTPWRVGEIIKVNGKTLYEVATNEYLDSADSRLNSSSNTNQSNNTKLIGYTKNRIVYMINGEGTTITSSVLGANTPWVVGDVIQNKKGDYFFQVATNQYVKKVDMDLNQTPKNIKQIPNFGIKNNTNDNQGNNNNNGSNSNNSNKGNSDYDKDNYYVDVDSIDIPTIKSSLVKYINSERAKMGSKPVTEHPYLMSTAQTRSQEAVQNYSHERPDGTLWNTVIDKDKYWKTREGENLVIVTSQLSKADSDNPADFVAKMANEGFKSDALHYGVMTDKYFINVGIGVTLDKANNRFYVVEHFWD